MYRRLHNSLVALSASAALLVLALVVARPIHPQALTAAPALAAVNAHPAAPPVRGHRHRSHALRLPFFSFASRN